jgi:photosystem II stability/assembly factor-like uncharacterized protein
MKRLTALLLVLAFAACSAPAAAPSATATVAVASPTPSPAPTTAAPTPTVAPTATPTLIPLPNVAQLSAPSATVIWALVANTRLFRSTDRGDSWQERPLQGQPANPLVSFVDDHEGWLATLGSPAAQCQSQTFALSHTADAGATWSSLTVTGIAPAQCKNTVTFSDATHGFVTASDPNSAPVVYRTTDGGQSWTASRPLPAAAGSTAGLTPVSLRSFGTTLLADVNGQNGHNAYRSTDGGATWTDVSTAPGQQDVIAFVTATRWLQISSPGSSKETTDSGTTWHAFTTDYQQAAPIAPTITFGDAQVGYATVRGAIQRTIDGGAHWTSIRTPGTF